VEAARQNRDMPAAPPLPALTHHEIFSLVELFTRAGHAVDLAASDRSARRLRFKPQPRLLAGASGSEWLELDASEPGRFVLSRIGRPASGPAARLEATGSHLAELLTRIAAVPAEAQFRGGPGWVVAHSHRAEAAAGGALRLTASEAHAGALTLQARLPAIAGFPAEVELAAGGRASDEASAEALIDLPDDLLAVLGRRWVRLWRVGPQWHSTLRLTGRDPERSRRAEADIEAAAAHLALTLAEPPTRFHQRLAGARWAFAARRALPAFSVLVMIGAALAVPQLDMADNSVLRMLVFNAPPLLLALGVCLQELPRFELPRPPRPLKAPAWHVPAAHP